MPPPPTSNTTTSDDGAAGASGPPRFDGPDLGLSRTGRFHEIVQILLRHDAWGLLRDVQRKQPGADTPDARRDQARRLREILEDLGPTFIKLGQLLATRPDLVSEPFVAELKQLYDQTRPTPIDQVRGLLRSEMGRPVEEVFATFEPVPLASGSIGQVHRATLRDGTPVAVKVQHTGIEDAMRLDHEILRGILRFTERTFAATRVWQPLDHLEELRQMLEEELDYRNEMRNTIRVREDFAGDKTVVVPGMFEHLCTRRVLVMEFIQGIRFGDLSALAGINRTNVARIVTHAMAKQIFVHRFFHADPSPGNMLILDSGRVAFLDFGAVGVVSQRRARAILQFLAAVAKGDVEMTTEAILDLCDQRAEVDQRRLLADVERLLAHFQRGDSSVADPRLMEMLLELARAHRMVLPPDFVLINRALFQFEGFCRELDPQYDLVQVLEPLVGEVIWRRMGPGATREALEEAATQALSLLRTAPATAGRLLRRAERNELTLRLDVLGMEDLKSAQGRGVLKMSFSIMMASLVVGLGILYASPSAPSLLPFLFSAATVTLVWVLVMVVWSESFKGRRD